MASLLVHSGCHRDPEVEKDEAHGDDEVIVERFSAYMDSWNLVNFSWNRTGVSNLLRKRTEISDTGWERFLIDQTLVLWCCFCKGFTIWVNYR